MTTTADVVVAGAGHNSLITAAYLAPPGTRWSCSTPARSRAAGRRARSCCSPATAIDSCSTGHTLIQTNPLLLDDELGLQADYGLEYLVPDPFAHVAFPDGRHLTMWMDVERTCEEIARFSKADAAAYRRALAEYDEVKDVFGAATFTPPGFGPVARASGWPSTRAGGIWQRRRLMSAWDVIRHEYESEHVRSFMLWQAFQTLVPIDLPGSGQLASSIVFGRQRRSWTLPRGGSGALTDALVRFIEDHGGTRPVPTAGRPAGPRGGRCAGVETETGERFLAPRGGRLDHPRQAPARHGAGRRAGPRSSASASRPSTSACPAFAVYLATTAAPVFETEDGPRSAVSAGLSRLAAGDRRPPARAARRPLRRRRRRGCSSPRRRSPIPRARPRATTR